MIPLWLKISYTAFTAVTVVVYARKLPVANFLWFSDIALVLTVPALWLESSLLTSTAAVSILLPEMFWNAGFFLRLLSGKRLAGLTDYMFDRSKPYYLRALSLFHVVLPVLLLWMLSRLGYAPQALLLQTCLAWIVLPLIYALTDPSLNVNWVFGPSGRRWLPPLAHLGLMMLAAPLLLYLPTHFLLRTLFPGP